LTSEQLDCGIHPASNDISALPFFDLIDPAEIDLVLITQYDSIAFPTQILTPASTSTTAARCRTSPSERTSKPPST